jgi:hypothetical protein
MKLAKRVKYVHPLLSRLGFKRHQRELEVLADPEPERLMKLIGRVGVV